MNIDEAKTKVSKPGETVTPIRFSRKLFLWIFRKQIADIIYNHEDSIKLRHVLALNKSVNSVYIEALEFIISDIDKYFTLGSGLSARKAMRDMQDFCGHRLQTLKKLLSEYTKLETTDESS